MNPSTSTRMSLTKNPTVAIAYFISPHGFGHAARACAVMTALRRINPAIHFHIFTQIPAWFFQQERGLRFSHHEMTTDVGLHQLDPLHHDLDRTLAELKQFIPFDRESVDTLGATLHRLKCQLVINDISPLGIAGANRARLPCVLIENFTWDWIYREYLDIHPEFAAIIAYLEETVNTCQYIIQTQPYCTPRRADLTTYPVSREPRRSSDSTRQALDIPGNNRMVTITMGGTQSDLSLHAQLNKRSDCTFIIPGSTKTLEHRNNVVTLPQRSEFYHPDIIQASNLVIGKLGYSTVAEVYYAGIPMGYLTRRAFRESDTLATFADNYLGGVELRAEDFENGAWLDTIPQMDVSPRRRRNHTNGAMQIANFLTQLL